MPNELKPCPVCGAKAYIRRLTMSEYRKIAGFPYSVSDKGEVRNDRTGNFVKPILSNSGYYRVRLWDHGKNKNFFVHRLVAIAFVPVGYGHFERRWDEDGNKWQIKCVKCTSGRTVKDTDKEVLRAKQERA